MDKSWMRLARSSDEYAAGVRKFVQFAAANSGKNAKILCPCKNCANRFRLADQLVWDHLICVGFINGYTTWVYHGENAVVAEPVAETTQDQVEYADKEEMDHMLFDAFGMYDKSTLDSDLSENSDDESDADLESYKNLVNEASQELYPGCKTFSKLQFLVRLLNIKNMWRMSNGCFEEVLKLFKDVIQQGQFLPKNLHDAKKYINSVGLGYDSHDACINDCIVFKGQYADASVCPTCNTSRWKSEKTGVDGKRMYKVARKVSRHFPLDSRIHMLFMSSKTGPHMGWVDEGRIKDGLMRHPADSPAWKHFDATHKWFGAEPRNVRFGLATDGFNPFRNMNLSYSIWPILLIPYNLPPWLCMKETNFILSVIVPGRKAPGKEMDVYMQLTLDDLLRCWNHGVLTYDAYVGKKFRVYAALLWTVSDWLGRGCLSGESIAVCSHCLSNTCSRWLKHGHKKCYLGHRRFLGPDHEFRKDAASFDNSTEFREPPIQPSGKEISDMTKNIETRYGKLQKPKRVAKKRKKRALDDEEEPGDHMDEHSLSTTFKKRSCFFQLPYWETLLVRHNLDPMHIEKNVFDNIVNTLLDVDKRTKDNYNARLDLKDMNIRLDLQVDETDPGKRLPEAIYSMSSDKKKMFCNVLKEARFPDGYASNLYNKVRLDEKRLVGFKSHDCHVVMHDLLPLAISRTLPENVAMPLIRLSNYFKKVYSKVISVTEMQMLEAEIPVILCQLEKIFPPAFFDMMVHLVVHLATEVRLAGPTQFRSMWSVERYIGKLKNMVHTRSHPEGAIAEGCTFDESVTFASR